MRQTGKSNEMKAKDLGRVQQARCLGLGGTEPKMAHRHRKTRPRRRTGTGERAQDGAQAQVDAPLSVRHGCRAGGGEGERSVGQKLSLVRMLPEDVQGSWGDVCWRSPACGFCLKGGSPGARAAPRQSCWDAQVSMACVLDHRHVDVLNEVGVVVLR